MIIVVPFKHYKPYPPKIKVASINNLVKKIRKILKFCFKITNLRHINTSAHLIYKLKQFTFYYRIIIIILHWFVK